MKDKFCVFIISYQRAGRIDTIKMLNNQGYTGDYFIVISEDDKEKENYFNLYKDKVIIFNKKDYKWVDLADNEFDKLGTPLFVRNALYDIAQELGYKYFLVLDDDYGGIYWMCNSRFEYKKILIKNLDKVFERVLEFYKKTPFKMIAFAQYGDFIMGEDTFYQLLFDDLIWFRRKVMNSFFCSVDRRVEWKSRLNDDVCTYVYWGNRGDLFMTIYLISVQQKLTQQNKGGLTPEYRLFGTYNKSFRPIMFCPSACVISRLGLHRPRIHHKIFWKNLVPAILSEKYL